MGSACCVLSVKRMGMPLLTNPSGTKLGMDGVKILQKASADAVLKGWRSTQRLSALQLSRICNAGDVCDLPASTRLDPV